MPKNNDGEELKLLEQQLEKYKERLDKLFL